MRIAIAALALAATVSCQQPSNAERAKSPGKPGKDCSKDAARRGAYDKLPELRDELALAPTPSYESDVRTILSACAGCHADAGGSGGIGLASYQSAKRNAAASIASAEAGRMPPSGGKLDATKIATLKAWQAAGYPERATEPSDDGSGDGDNDGAVDDATDDGDGGGGGGGGGGGQSPTGISYDGAIRWYLAKYCVSCHAGTKAPSLSTYSAAATAGDKILNRIGREPSAQGFMPKGKSKLPDDVINDFKAWKAAGFPRSEGASGAAGAGTAGPPDC